MCESRFYAACPERNGLGVTADRRITAAWADRDAALLTFRDCRLKGFHCRLLKRNGRAADRGRFAFHAFLECRNVILILEDDLRWRRSFRYENRAVFSKQKLAHIVGRMRERTW